MSAMRLDGKTALITGASQGIGAAVARLLAGQGAKVVLAARSEDKLADLAGELGDAALPFALDVSKPEQVAERLSELPEGFADIDILVNNAGITADGLLARMDLEQWQRVLDVNLTGAYAVTKALLRGMIRRRGGRIVMVSSVVGMMGNPGQTNYAASKAGLIGFAKSLAKEVGSRNITVNVVAPGYIETAMTGELPDSAREELTRNLVIKRLGQVEDIAGAVLYLASDEAAYVTGQVLNVSGGLYV